MSTMVRGMPRWYRNTQGSDLLVRGGLEDPLVKETASQAWKTGDMLYVAAAGTISIATRASTLSDDSIDAIALCNATGVTANPTLVGAIRPSDVFVMNVFHATPASAISAVAQIGQRYGLIYEANASAVNVWMIDINNTTVEDGTHSTARVRVVGMPTEFYPDTSNNMVQPAIGDTYGLMLVQFLPFSVASDGTPVTHNMRLA